MYIQIQIDMCVIYRAKKHKNNKYSQVWRLKPVMLSNQDTDMGRIMVQEISVQPMR
jgi:hypothetical protein